jgi:flagellar secretion chaperone FliS
MTNVIDHALKTYARMDVETGVAGATPEMLIVMLYDGAIRAIATARVSIEAGDQQGKGQSISKAIGIIEEGLRGSLDAAAGGELGSNLSDLYEYMSHRLMLANLRNDSSMLDEVSDLLRALKTAWDGLISPQGVAVPESRDAPPARASTSYGRV